MVARLDAGFHQAAEVGLGPHVAAEGFYGVVVEAGFVEVGARLTGFRLERQWVNPAESASEKALSAANGSAQIPYPA